MIVSDAKIWSITYDHYYDDRNGFIIQATAQRAGLNYKYQAWLKYFPRANYYVCLSQLSVKKKSLTRLAPRVNMTLFFFVVDG
jgi:hypothetical protein